jgi:ABC-2 type transport system ATP-binding protein
MPELLDSASPGGRDRPIERTQAPTRPVEVAEPARSAVPAAPMMLCQRVSKWYGAVRGVLDVTLELRGGLTGLVGANGAGKTTLIRLITGQLRPDSGSVQIAGIDAHRPEARRLIGYCPDTDAFYEEMSGRAFVREMARLCGFTSSEVHRRTEAVLARVGMAERADRPIRGYSKGMRQRVKLAQALLHDPPLLVLDEPMSGIDPVGRAEFVTLFHSLANQGKCLLVSSHELDELEKLTNHVVIMSHGRIAAADTVPRIRERLVAAPLTYRLDVQRGESGTRHRQLAAQLLQRLPSLSRIELSEPSEQIGRLLIQTDSPPSFLSVLQSLILEEWYELLHLQAFDESTAAVLEYLLNCRR